MGLQEGSTNRPEMFQKIICKDFELQCVCAVIICHTSIFCNFAATYQPESNLFAESVEPADSASHPDEDIHLFSYQPNS